MEKTKSFSLSFFIKLWEQDGRGHSTTLFSDHSDTCHKICFAGTSSSATVAEVEELKYSHEEADTRLLLHAKFARQTVNSAVILSPDTDVLILCIAKFKDLDCCLWFETGTGNSQIY